MSGSVTPLRVLVLGGARSGKSRYALALAERRWKKPLYLATAEVFDAEMAARIKTHRRGRGRHWQCLEEPLNIAEVICGGRPRLRHDGILVDCLTLWLSNVLIKEGKLAVRARQRALVAAIKKAPQDVILVSNEVGLGVIPDTVLGRQFRDLAGWLNQAVAEEVGTVVFVAAGLPVALKGGLPDLSVVSGT